MRRRLVFLSAAVLLACGCSTGDTVTPTPALRAQAAYHRGNAKLVAGDFVAAKKLLRRAVRMDPSLVQAHQALGETYLGLMRGPAAAEQFHLALKLEPKKYLAWMGLGDALRLEGRLDKSKDAYAHAATLDTTLPTPFSSEGEVLRDARQFKGAAVAFEKAAGRAKGKASAPLYAEAGKAWGSAGRWTKAAADLERAAKAKPGDADAWDRLGQARARAGDTKGVVAAYAEAVKDAPKDPLLWEILGTARRAIGDAAGARKAYETAKTLAPGRASVWEGLGRLDLDAGNTAAATKDAEKALAVLGGTTRKPTGNPKENGRRALADMTNEADDDTVVANVADLLGRVGDHERSAALYRMLLGDKKPHGAALWLALAHEDAARGKADRVTSDCAKARKKAGKTKVPGLGWCDHPAVGARPKP